MIYTLISFAALCQAQTRPSVTAGPTRRALSKGVKLEDRCSVRREPFCDHGPYGPPSEHDSEHDVHFKPQCQWNDEENTCDEICTNWRGIKLIKGLEGDKLFTMKEFRLKCKGTGKRICKKGTVIYYKATKFVAEELEKGIKKKGEKFMKPCQDDTNKNILYTCDSKNAIIIDVTACSSLRANFN